MTHETRVQKISKEHYKRVVEIVSNPDNEFHDVSEKMGALHGRMLIFMAEIDESEHD